MSGAIWIASYPKSGNTWVRLALQSLSRGGAAVGLDEIHAFGGPVAVHDLMERLLNVETGHLTTAEIDALRPDFHAALIGTSLAPLALKVHDAWVRTDDGRPLFDPRLTSATLYLIRDPRDVAISWATFIGCGIDAAIDTLANPGMKLGANPVRRTTQMQERVGDWSGHVRGWIDESGLDPLVIRYEDMLADPALALRRMADRLGWPATDEAIAGAVETTRFKDLAEQERRHGFVGRADTTESFFRSGTAGQWRTDLTSTQANRVEHDHGEVMARFGYL